MDNAAAECCSARCWCQEPSLTFFVCDEKKRFVETLDNLDGLPCSRTYLSRYYLSRNSHLFHKMDGYTMSKVIDPQADAIKETPLLLQRVLAGEVERMFHVW